MSSLNALKYKVSVNASYYAAGVMFLLYLLVIMLTLTVVSLSFFSLPFYFILFGIALYASKKSFLEQGVLLLSDSGLVERILGGKSFNGSIGQSSFYNGFFIFLQLEVTNSTFLQKKNRQFMIIYKDAITNEQYRLLARLIKSGRN